MPQRIKCPTGHSLIVSDDRAGRTLRCPRCGESVLVPGEPAAQGTAALELSAPVAVDHALAQVVAEPARAVAVVPPSRPTALKSQRPLQASNQSRPAPPLVKPKSRVLPVPPASPPPRPAIVEPPPPPPVVKTTVVEAPPPPRAVMDGWQAAQVEPIAEPRLGGSLALPARLAPSEPPPVAPLPEPPPAPSVELISLPEPAIEPPSAITASIPPPPAGPASQPAHDSSEDIAAFLSLRFGDTPVPAAPRRATSQTAQDPLDADASRTLGVYQLAAALVVAAIFSVAPAVWDLIEYIRIDDLDAPFVARWAIVLFFLGVVQLAYAVYLFQLPDWATVWVVTMFQLLLAAGYAAVLGMVLISEGDGFLVGPSGLQLADKLAGGKAALWCLCMVSVATILAFFAGRMSVRWRQAERMLHRACIT